MENATFHNIADIVEFIAGLMTIFGISGFLSWSFLRFERGLLATNSISIFAYSTKIGLCILLLWPMFSPFAALKILVLLTVGPSAVGGNNFWWDNAYPTASLASYLVAIVVSIPLYTVACACITLGSFAPFRIFLGAFRRKAQTGVGQRA